MTARDGKSSRACPKCGYRKAAVIDSRPTNGGYRTWRRLRCNDCKHRWSTIEAPTCRLPDPSPSERAACLGRWLYRHDVQTMGVKAVIETK